MEQVTSRCFFFASQMISSIQKVNVLANDEFIKILYFFRLRVWLFGHTYKHTHFIKNYQQSGLDEIFQHYSNEIQNFYFNCVLDSSLLWIGSFKTFGTKNFEFSQLHMMTLFTFVAEFSAGISTTISSARIILRWVARRKKGKKCKIMFHNLRALREFLVRFKCTSSRSIIHIATVSKCWANTVPKS